LLNTECQPGSVIEFKERASTHEEMKEEEEEEVEGSVG